ncbi:hypothetical protein OAP50_01420, partial [bacterium]|nr:hypothetical protein [bacterium]
MGEWCKEYSKKSIWEKMDYRVIDYHWDDKYKAKDDYVFIQDIYEEALIFLSEKLNDYHNTNYSKRYWRLLLNPWLFLFSYTLYDRWFMIKKVLNEENYLIDGTSIINLNDQEMIPFSGSEIRSHLGPHGDMWNHFIFSKVYKKFSNNYTTINKKTEEFFPSRKRRQSKSYLISSSGIKDRYNSFANLFKKESDALIVNHQLGLKNYLKIQLALKQVPIFYTSKTIPDKKVRPKLELREKVLTKNIKIDNSFENFFYEMIPKQLPTCYFEGYGDLIQESENCKYPKNPKFIMSYSAYSSSDIFKAWAGKR